ncbi:hypothetical protein BC938DRAFT_478775 [Jimgerdemannia flammicorona]|uniref:Uncharacterized protein n=1 Tax=Jimgerdemannia flammicorona TaxID=994334 RepID=A0A433QMB9_9FUNG|nr:hypothetical protein BC938DRAFT_478775 [Jimgerdemannia flammicorona]
MFLERLDVTDLQHDKMSLCRAQIELTNRWASRHSDIKFLSMHPGWTDTPGLAKSMTGFYDKLKLSMRTSDLGADTINWAACRAEAFYWVSEFG